MIPTWQPYSISNVGSIATILRCKGAQPFTLVPRFAINPTVIAVEPLRHSSMAEQHIKRQDSAGGTA